MRGFSRQLQACIQRKVRPAGVAPAQKRICQWHYSVCLPITDVRIVIMRIVIRGGREPLTGKAQPPSHAPDGA